MDRDRRPPPPLDYPVEDAYRGGRGQSYRPGGARERSPTRGNDTYRARTPPRRGDLSDGFRGGPPFGRSPPRRDTFRRRSPSPGRFRDRDPRAAPDIYRARPRSPPPRREDLPRDDLFRRDVVGRDGREEGEYARDDRARGGYGGAPRSPPRFRDRSPIPPKRGREPSPVGSRGRRSPPPLKRERLTSPGPSARGRFNDYLPPSRSQPSPGRRFSPEPRDRRDFVPTTRSPIPRNGRADVRPGEDWRRPRSPSPQTGRGSNATSRRSSPPTHPSRMIPQITTESSASRSRDLHETPYQSGSPGMRRPASPLSREPTQQPIERTYGDSSHMEGNDRIPPPREPSRAESFSNTPRQPPTGPSGQRGPPSSNMNVPTGPAAGSPPLGGMSKGPGSAPFAPLGPRGAYGQGRGESLAPRGRGGYRGDFGAPRGNFGGPSSRGGGRGSAPTGPGFGGRGGSGPAPSGPAFEREAEPSSSTSTVPPSGPRGSSSQAPHPPPQAFRSSSSTSIPSVPRGQRFGPGSGSLAPSSSAPDSSATPTGPRAFMRRTTDSSFPPDGPSSSSFSSSSHHRSVPQGPHPSLADLPLIKPGGEKAAPIIDRSKLDRLEDEAEKLRRVIDEKETKKRRSLREWERLTRETSAAGFRSQVAEEALRLVSGEAEGTAAF